jgi:hypothetical protein
MIYHGRILQNDEVISRLDSLDGFTLHVFFKVVAHERESESVGTADVRGFDRLARMNYTPDQIARIREGFHVMHGTGDATQEERIEAEEEWFPVLFNHEVPLQDLAPLRELFGLRDRIRPPVNQNEREGIEDIPPEDEFNLQSRWIRALFGFLVGGIFGIGSLIFLLVSLNDIWFLMGLFLGTMLHYSVRYWMGMDIAG